MIDFKTIKNAIAQGLYDYTGDLVVSADRKQKKPPYPFISLKFQNVLTNVPDYPSETIFPDGEELKVTQVMNPNMTLSITCIGEYEQDAIDLALHAYGWFKTAGYYELEQQNVVVASLEPITNRNIVLGEVEYEYRHGFDVRLRVNGELTYAVNSIDRVEVNKGWIE